MNTSQEMQEAATEVQHVATADGNAWSCTCGAGNTDMITFGSARRESYMHMENEKRKVRPRLIADLERALQPSYVGWEDQYKAILNALNIDMDLPLAAFQKHGECC